MVDGRLKVGNLGENGSGKEQEEISGRGKRSTVFRRNEKEGKRKEKKRTKIEEKRRHLRRTYACHKKSNSYLFFIF